MMVGTRRAEEVIDPNLGVKPTTKSLKRALLVALRCVDPDSEKRPKMGHVVRMLDADEFPFRQDRRNRGQTGSVEIESLKERSGSMDMDEVEKSDS